MWASLDAHEYRSASIVRRLYRLFASFSEANSASIRLIQHQTLTGVRGKWSFPKIARGTIGTAGIAWKRCQNQQIRLQPDCLVSQRNWQCRFVERSQDDPRGDATCFPVRLPPSHSTGSGKAEFGLRSQHTHQGTKGLYAIASSRKAIRRKKTHDHSERSPASSPRKG